MQRREHCDEFAALDELWKAGPLPRELEERYQRLRRQRLIKAGLKRDRSFPTSPSRLNPEMSAGEWLRAKWASADATVRHSLRLLADSLGVPLPLRRTRHVAGQDSSGSQRSETDQQPNHGESARSESPPETEPQDRYDGPQWSDDDALDWEPCESLHDAMHPQDRGWY